MHKLALLSVASFVAWSDAQIPSSAMLGMVVTPIVILKSSFGTLLARITYFLFCAFQNAAEKSSLGDSMAKLIKKSGTGLPPGKPPPLVGKLTKTV